MKYREFQKRVKNNTQVLKQALEDKKPLVSILPELATFNSLPGKLHTSVILRKAHDILPAAYLGLLANIESNGTDAFKVLKDNTVVPYELKTSEIDSTKIWRGEHDGLYIGQNSIVKNNASIRSRLRAHYKKMSPATLLSKKMHTILLVSDISGCDGYFAAYEMEPDVILKEYLTKIEKSEASNFSIKMGGFLKFGRPAKTVVPLTGYLEWEENVRKIAPKFEEDLLDYEDWREYYAKKYLNY